MLHAVSSASFSPPQPYQNHHMQCSSSSPYLHLVRLRAVQQICSVDTFSLYSLVLALAFPLLQSRQSNEDCSFLLKAPEKSTFLLDFVKALGLADEKTVDSCSSECVALDAVVQVSVYVLAQDPS